MNYVIQITINESINCINVTFYHNLFPENFIVHINIRILINRILIDFDYLYPIIENDISIIIYDKSLILFDLLLTNTKLLY